VIAVVAADPLLLAVPRDSPLRSLQGLSASGARSLSMPFFSVAEDRFQTSSLAALVQRYGLTGGIPYSVAASAREAIIDTEIGRASVALAPGSEIRGELRAGRMQRLPWPRGEGRPPESWIAILGPTGLSGLQVAALRAEARRLYGTSVWDAVLRGDGLSPASLGRAALGGFIASNLARTSALERAAARVMNEF
jgi:tripartite-type tricarboxylate transporter receptor subunit TctC